MDRPYGLLVVWLDIGIVPSTEVKFRSLVEPHSRYCDAGRLRLGAPSGQAIVDGYDFLPDQHA